MLNDHPASPRRIPHLFGDKNVKNKAFKDPSGRFELEYPTKDWSPLPTGGSAVAILARKDGTQPS